MKTRLLAMLGLACLLGGCASTASSPGLRLLKQGDAPAAVEALRRESNAHPEDAWRRRDLGLALTEAGRAQEAVEILKGVCPFLPKDKPTWFYLGKACGLSDDLEGALAAYREYLRLGGSGGVEVQARLQSLSLRLAEKQARWAVAHEESLSVAGIPENSLAVPSFAHPGETDSLMPLSRGLAAMVITDLNQVGRFRVLERARLRVLMDELHLTAAPAVPTTAPRPLQLPSLSTPEGVGQRLAVLIRRSTGQPYLAISGGQRTPQPAALREAVRAFQSDHGLNADGTAGPQTQTALAEAWDKAGGNSIPAPAQAQAQAEVDSATAPRLGRLLGARRFILGSFLTLPREQIQLDALILETTSGISRAAGAPVLGPLSGVLRLEKQLVAHILEAFGITPTADERRLIELFPTEDFPAFLAFSRGLTYEEQGRMPEALASYQEAVNRDPSFALAADHLRVGAVTETGQKALDHSEILGATRPAATDPDVAVRASTWTGLGPGPEMDRTDDLNPGRNDAEIAGSQDAHIIVEGDLPGGRPR